MLKRYKKALICVTSAWLYLAIAQAGDSVISSAPIVNYNSPINSTISYQDATAIFGGKTTYVNCQSMTEKKKSIPREAGYYQIYSTGEIYFVSQADCLSIEPNMIPGIRSYLGSVFDAFRYNNGCITDNSLKSCLTLTGVISGGCGDYKYNGKTNVGCWDLVNHAWIP
ncbi:MAG: hypothetical protein ABW168_03335 [Sedimenticola sp.]